MPPVELHVELLNYTPDCERTVAMAARLCYSGAEIEKLKQYGEQQAGEFIGRLMGMGHLSPLEHASFTFGVSGVSRALLAQLTRHRIASFSVQSQRYVQQGGAEGFNYILPPAIEALGADSMRAYMKQMETMHGWYQQWMKELGGNAESAKEDARFVLPNACETRIMFTMNARELLHFFSLRCCERAQWEIRAMAWRMLGLLLPIAPNLFEKAGPSCVSGACGEGAKSCGKAAAVREKHAQLFNANE